jgi:hypothetical protein
VKRKILLLSLLALAACAKVGKLEPVAPTPMPVKAEAAPRAPTPEQMLVLPPQSAPNRVDDPIENSQEQQDDRFNLPPPGTR